MKRLLLALLTCWAVSAYAQPITLYRVATISAMKTYAGFANRVYVDATSQDYILCTSCTADEVTVFAGASGRKWQIALSVGSTGETDPVFTASDVFGVTSTNISNWNTAYGWGNHATAGYLTSFTEADPTVNTLIKNMPVSASATTNLYYYWNNGAIGRRQIPYSDLSGTPTLSTVATSGAYADLTGKPDLSVYELLANKSTSTSLGTSNTLYPTQNAVKTYVDNAVAASGGYSAELAQDDVAGIFNTSEFTYNDATPSVVLNAVPWAKVTGAPSFLTTESDPTIPHTADASTNKYLNWDGSAYTRKQIDYTEIASTPSLAGYEQTANKATGFGTLNNTLYPTTQAVSTYVTGLGYVTANLYTANGTLAGNRTITGGGNYLALTGGRWQEAKGSNVAAANNLTLGGDGNTFTITGNTQVNAITNTNWQAGSKVSLIFTGTPTVKHNTAGAAGTSVVLLSGAADYTAAVNDVLELVYDGTSWHETARKIATTGGGRMVYPGSGVAVSTGNAWTTSLANTTVGTNILTLTNPSAVRWIRINADNSVTARTAAETLADIGAQAAGSYQAQLNGTGFVKASGTTISYDNSTYLTTEVDGSTTNELQNLGTGTQTASVYPITITNGTGISVPVFGTNAGLVPGTTSNTTSYLRADGTFNIPPGTYTLPTASTTVLGGVKVDGTTVTIDGAGVISAAAGTNIYNSNGSLTSARTVTQGTNRLTFTGSGTSNSTSNLLVSATGANGLAMEISTAGRGLLITGSAAGHNPLTVSAQGAGFGAEIGAIDGAALYLHRDPASTNTIVNTLQLSRFSTGTAANGIGQSIDLYTQTSTGSGQLANQIISQWTDAANATRTSQMEFWGVNSGTNALKLALKGSGQAQLPAYTGTGSFPITAVGLLGFDASGNIGTVATPSGGANASGTYIVQTATNAPANAQILASLATGLVKNTTTTGVLSIATAGTDYLTPTGSGASLTGITAAQVGAQAADADLTTYAGITPTTVGQSWLSTANPSAITFPKVLANNTVAYESAATHRTSIGGTTVGQNLFTLVNPSAVSFMQINADNTVSTLTAAGMRSAIGAGTGNGTVTNFSAGDATNLFTTSEATTTTTPALTFNMNTQTANTVFAGPVSGGVAAPTFRSLVAADLPTGSGNYIQAQYASRQAASAMYDTANVLRVRTAGLNGNLTDAVNYFYMPVKRIGTQTAPANAGTQLVFSNHTQADDEAGGYDWTYWKTRGGNALAWFHRRFVEAENDTADQQYNAMINGVNKYELNPASTRFDSTLGRAYTLQNSGVYMVTQLFPTANTVVNLQATGATGAPMVGNWGFGSAAYNITWNPGTVSPVPATVYQSDIDFNRAAASSAQRMMKGGLGIAGYLSHWKSYQSGLGAGVLNTGSVITRVTDFFSKGSLNNDPFTGQGFTKTQILTISRVDTAVGFYSYPKRTSVNEVVNGYGVVQEGADDLNWHQGKSFFGGTTWPQYTTSSVWPNKTVNITNGFRVSGDTSYLHELKVYEQISGSVHRTRINANLDSLRDITIETGGSLIGDGGGGTITMRGPQSAATEKGGIEAAFRTGVNANASFKIWRVNTAGTFTARFEQRDLYAYFNSRLIVNGTTDDASTALQVTGTGKFSALAGFGAGYVAVDNNGQLSWSAGSGGGGGSGTVSSGTAGRIGTYLSTGTTISESNANFVWDNTNSEVRLGGGADAGAYAFQLTGNAWLSSNLIWDATATELRLGGGADMGAYALQVTGNVRITQNVDLPGSTFTWGGSSNSNNIALSTLATASVGNIIWTNTDMYIRSNGTGGAGTLRLGAGGSNDLAILNAAGEFQIASTTDLGNAKLQVTGNVIFKTLETDGTAPTTSGTVEMVIVDADGLLSRQAITGGGSGTVSSGTANQITFYTATGTTVGGATNMLINNAANELYVNTGGTDFGTFGLQVGGSAWFNSLIHANGTIQLTEIASPGTPSTNYGRLYAATDGTLHYLNDAGTDIALGAGGTADVSAAGNNVWTGTNVFNQFVTWKTSGSASNMGYLGATVRNTTEFYGNVTFMNNQNANQSVLTQSATTSGNVTIELPDVSGQLAVTSQLGGLISQSIVTSGTTVSAPTGATKAWIRMVGGGGGGGGSTGAANNAGVGGGGGAGAYLEIVLTSGISGGTSYTVAIGSAGAGGANTGATGSAGGSTTITVGATTYTAPGGLGGVGMTSGTATALSKGGDGAAVATNGTINTGGDPGNPGVRLSGTVAVSGVGGTSKFGSGGYPLSASGAGVAAKGYGGGGGGAASVGNQNNTGGAGTQGAILIFWYR